MRLAAVVASAALACAAGPATASALPQGMPYEGTAWSWAHPTPQGTDLGSVDFRGDYGVAASAGRPLVSVDGGLSWARSPLPPGMTAVSLVGARTILGFGPDCSLLRSEDGRTVRRLTAPASDDRCASRYSFPTASVGYVERGGVLLRTEDGGATFEARTAVPNATDLLFTGADTGFAMAGGTISRTADGGRSWTPVASTSAMLTDIAFADAARGVAVGDSGTVLRTGDGGVTWSRAPAAGLSRTGSLRAVRCLDAGRCLAVGRQDEAHSEPGTVFRLDGAGDTAVPVTGSEGTLGVAYAGPGRAVAVGDSGLTLVSDDLGASFRETSGNARTAYNRLWRGSGDTVFATGNGVGRSDDGGRTWQRLPLEVPGEQTVSAASFAGPREAYVSVAAIDIDARSFALWGTRDGGASWTLRRRARSGRPEQLLALGRERVVAMPRGRGLLLSRDGGRRFTRVRDRTVRGLQGVAVSRRGRLGAVAGRRTLALTRDGSSWRRVALPRGTLVANVELVSRRHIVLTTESGRLLGTRDGGRSWRALTGQGDFAPVGVSFLDARHGLMLGAAAAYGEPDSIEAEFTLVLRTDDGGRSWRPQFEDRRSHTSGLLIGARSAVVTREYDDLLWSGTGGDPAVRRSIRVAARRAGRSVRVTGRLSRPRPGERVLVSRVKGDRRAGRLVRVARNGRFAVRVPARDTAYVVAQAVGDQNVAGAGSRAVRVKGRR